MTECVVCGVTRAAWLRVIEDGDTLLLCGWRCLSALSERRLRGGGQMRMEA